MYWGFQCEDGWFELLRELSLALTKHLEKNPRLDLEVKQVKAKLGSLRFYMKGGDAFTEKLVNDACERASHVCEISGREGRLCFAITEKGSRFSCLPRILCDEKANELSHSPAE